MPYRAFPTKDGDILIGGGNDRLFGVLCDAIGRPAWKDDPKFSSNAQRVAHRDELEAQLEDITRQRTTAEWLAAFDGKGMPYAPINDIKTALGLPHTLARNMVVEMEHPACGTIKMVNTPMKFSVSKADARTPPPLLGQHTDEVLEANLGLAADEIRALREKGVIR